MWCGVVGVCVCLRSALFFAIDVPVKPRRVFCIFCIIKCAVQEPVGAFHKLEFRTDVSHFILQRFFGCKRVNAVLEKTGAMEGDPVLDTIEDVVQVMFPVNEGHRFRNRIVFFNEQYSARFQDALHFLERALFGGRGHVVERDHAQNDVTGCVGDLFHVLVIPVQIGNVRVVVGIFFCPVGGGFNAKVLVCVSPERGLDSAQHVSISAAHIGEHGALIEAQRGGGSVRGGARGKIIQDFLNNKILAVFRCVRGGSGVGRAVGAHKGVNGVHCVGEEGGMDVGDMGAFPNPLAYLTLLAAGEA